MIEWRKNRNLAQSVKLLDQCLNLHVTATKEFPAGFEFYIKLNADFLLELAKEYLQHAGSKPIPLNEKPPRHL